MAAERALFICYNCNFAAWTKTRLIQHIGVGKCNLKANLGKSRLAYTRHNPLTDYVCTHCNIVFRRKLSLDEHIIKRHNIESIGSVSSEIHGCAHCDYKTTRNNTLNRHMLTHPTVVYFSICKYCNASFKSEQSLDNHVIKKHPDFIASIGKKIHECSNCAYKTTIPKYFKRHLKIHSSDKINTCEHCNATFKCKKSLDDHIVRKHPNFSASVSYRINQCPSCDYKSARKYDVDKHMLKHLDGDKRMLKHLDVDSSDNTIICKHCDGRYKSEQGLNNHIIKKHPDFIGSVTRKIHECSYCPFKTAYKRSFDGHMTSHSDVDSKLNACKHCTARFTCKYYLDDHIVKKHPDFIESVTRKIYECLHCPFKTVYKHRFDGHMTSHSDVDSKLNACKHCTATFTRKSNLADHIVKKHPDFIASVRRKIHKCPHCAYKTVRKDILERHILSHP
ncbi:unnamed protein product [Callosobruchus maculatus]|uniref:C2H2-type domain-containing protein n=1 Tax=Callosobruchus maculatus TaxID=64391 RepID=A0A653DGU7_CALMS|nr:unnamed protein product [Callosobruchus maculatus]